MNKMSLRVEVSEADIPESPRPWFKVEIDGKAYLGQAMRPPRPTQSGYLEFDLELDEV